MIYIDKWSGCKAFAWEKDTGKQRELIDFTSGGIFAAGLGPDSEVIHQAILRAGTSSAYAPRFGNYWRDRYYETLQEFTGFECAVAFCEGSVATEAFWRVARVYTGKPGIWGGLVDPDQVGESHALCDQFHGWTLGAMVMAGKMSYHELGIFPELGAGRFGQIPEHTASMIMEPYHAASGQFHRISPTIERVKALRAQFTEIPLCIDEIQGGFGRTGRIFAYQHYQDLKPDFVTVGKLAGAGFPLSALLGPREIMESESVRHAGHLHSTHSGHPMGCSVGVAVIDEIRRANLIEEAERKGAIMHGVMQSFPIRTHGKGLMAGLEFKNPEEAARVVQLCEDRGLLVVDTGRKWVKIGPALIIDDFTLAMGLSILQHVVEEIVNDRHSESEACGGSGTGPGDGPEDLRGDGIPSNSSGGDATGAEDAGSSRSSD